MIRQFYQHFYCFISKNYCKHIVLHSFEYADGVLSLDKPKLINFLDIKLNNSIVVSEDTQNFKYPVSNDTNIAYSSDKQYRVNSFSQEDVTNKKNKGKLVKKKRNTSHNIVNDDIFIETKEDLFSKDTLDSSLLKARKLNSKTKKKNKSKLENLNSDFNSLNGSDVSKNSVINSQSEQKSIVLNCPLTVEQLSSKLNIPEAEIITHLFLNKGISVTINQVLDIDTAKKIASHYSFTLLDFNEDLQNNFVPQDTLPSSNNIKRPPIVTILGHVDHGKTTLLDAILKTNLVVKESGGITQTIRGYEAECEHDLKTYKLIFLDTPGHQSFKEMRIRGAKITDVVLLVIAFDDGLKPQTIEAINYIKEMSLNCIAVITKTDKFNQNIDFILHDLANYGLVCKDWGGDLQVVQVSALTGRNIKALLSEICIISDTKDFVANPNSLASGTIFESYLDRKQGPIAYLVVQNGTLKIGDIIVSSGIYGKVKSIINLLSQKIVLATPSSVVQVLGFSNLPNAGSTFHVVFDDKEAKQYCISYSSPSNKLNLFTGFNNSLNQAIVSDIKEVRLLIKADTQGSLEAVIDLLSSIPQSKVKLRIISTSFGVISNSDIELAAVTQSMIISFNIDLSSNMIGLVKKHNIVFKKIKIIYDLFEYIKNIMLDLIEPNYDKIFIGRAFVRTVFNMNRRVVAGCYVSQGKLIKMCYICVNRKDQVVYEGKLSSLKVVKDDVTQVLSDNECGLMCDYNFWEKDDIIDAYELVPRKKTLQ
uniref:Translation initiation factor IF-2, chloroplastic n=1 Tax=Laurencia australis TaxID=3073067 RepID=A0AA51RC20_9FLOR|nr:Translation initiation factor IF-2 [Laurencia australis]WMP12050.1 Translation initiation factor IF-2 [Laurencia australis]